MALRKKNNVPVTSQKALENAHANLAAAVQHANNAVVLAVDEENAHNESAAYFAQQAVEAAERKRVATELTNLA